jgi:hypothetical protein
MNEFIMVDFRPRCRKIQSRVPMTTELNIRPPRWIVVRLADDLHWWVQETSDEPRAGRHSRGVLDPQQVAQLVEQLDAYQSYGYRREQFTAAFQVYEIHAEVADGCLRLVASEQDLFAAGAAQLFALPALTDEPGEGAYFDLLDTLETARIRHLNATHNYVRACTGEEMLEELEALDTDRYFGDDTLHAFDEISEILEWSPAE